MANKVIKKENQYKARIVTENQQPCAFCHRKVDEEINYGKFYAIGDIQCHYFCALLSCCLVQKGREEVGLFGFLYLDILAELERCKKHRCSYCGQGGASIGCCVSTCRKQFHLPCGRERDAVSLFYGTFKSYCRIHAPKQKIPEQIMAKAKIRMKQEKRVLKKSDNITTDNCGTEKSSEDMVCVICYEIVDGFPTLHTFWPPCCARDAWFHRSCLQRMALTAGMHYLKCPLCNDKDIFYDSLVSQGYYVPDRDAAWELEQNAFSEIYERPLICEADECLCPLGRKHDAENGPWDIKLCLLCGSVGRHAQCTTAMFICETCKPVAPSNLDELADKIDNLIQQEQSQINSRRGPVMPSRMSIRRTKGRDALLNRPSSSRADYSFNETEIQNTLSSRLELSIKPPRKPPTPRKPSDPENEGFISPNKLINGLQQKGFNLDDTLVEKIRRKILKPRPLSVKRRIVGETFNNFLKVMSPLKDHKLKELVKEWCSPKKHDIDNVEEQSHVSTPPKSSKTTTPIKKSETPSKSSKDSSKENLENMDESSNSTFVLPPEFVADVDSDDSCQFDNSKSKTIDIKHDSSLEIFEKNEAVGIDVIKVENPSFSKMFDFSPLHECKTINMDIENFKKEYLNEVDKKHKTVTENLCTLTLPEKEKKVNEKYKLKTEDLYVCTPLPTPEKEKKELSVGHFGICSKICPSDVETGGKKRRCQSETIENVSTKKRKMSENNLILHFPLSALNINNKKDQYKNIKNDKKINSKNDKKINSKNDKKINSKNDQKINSKNDKKIKNKNKKVNSQTERKINIKNDRKINSENDQKITREKDQIINSKNDKKINNENEANTAKKDKKSKFRKKKNKKIRSNKNLKLTLDSISTKTKNKKTKLRTKLSIKNKNIKLKIKFKKEQLSFELESKSSKNKKQKPVIKSNPLKQYILHYPTEGTSKDVLIKPEKEIKIMKKKKMKQEKSPDKFKQTSLHSFFKIKSSNDK